MSVDKWDCSYYDLLGIAPDASFEQVKRAYRLKIRETHPDLSGPESDATVFLRVKRAYEVLANPVERARYDMIAGFDSSGRGARLYRHSFDRLFSTLFEGLRTAMAARPDLADTFEHEKRRAG
jgi:curved DNA-binding protein CbpA